MAKKARKTKKVVPLGEQMWETKKLNIPAKVTSREYWQLDAKLRLSDDEVVLIEVLRSILDERIYQGRCDNCGSNCR